jgi:regulator of cell morphogenesis and NO signaling
MMVLPAPTLPKFNYMTNIAEQSLASIVTTHHETVPVLEKYHLDFCCKGKRTLSQACIEKGLATEEIIKELEASLNSTDPTNIPVVQMNAGQLIGHILLHHHFYVRQSMPTIEDHLMKVAAKHGSSFPYMKNVLELFTQLKSEMNLHMQKEEMILFPRIKEVESFAKYAQQQGRDQSYIYNPVAVIESEHDAAGSVMDQIRQLTNDYTAPAEACTTFKVVMDELRTFEEDLHQHVHLENNLLFPMAKKMMAV